MRRKKEAATMKHTCMLRLQLQAAGVWKPSRISCLHPGKDGGVREVGIFKRPVTAFVTTNNHSEVLLLRMDDVQDL